MNKIALRTFTSNSRKLTREKFHNASVLACEFIAYYACGNAGMKLKFTTKSGFKLRIMNSLIDVWEGWGRVVVHSTWLDCKLYRWKKVL